MNIQILCGIQEAQKATGICVVIDVFRAFTTACYAYDAGADMIIPVSSIEEALQLQSLHPSWLLMGEVDGVKPSKFNLSNSPSEILQHNLVHTTIVHRSSLGTQGILKAKNATEIITGSFVNFSAIITYIKKTNASIISLLATGSANLHSQDEDMLCALALQNALQNDMLPTDIPNLLKISPWSSLFFDEKVTSHPKEDFAYCADLNAFNFILKYETSDTIPYLKKIICT